MPRSIDSVGPRPEKKQPKPVAQHKAGEVIRPKGSAPRAGETVLPEGLIHNDETKTPKTNVGKAKPPKRPIPKKPLILGLVGFAVILLISLIAIWVVRGTRLIESLTKPKPAPGTYAEVGDQNASLDEYEKLKKAYGGFNKKQANPESDTLIAQRASKDLLEYLALKAEAQKQGIDCNQQTVDTRLAQRYADRGGRDQYYAFLNQEYGWDESVVMMRECSDYYREQLATKLIGGTDVFGVYIRWDVLGDTTSPAERQAFENQARERLEKDFRPLFTSGATQEQIYRAADISTYTSNARFDELMQAPGNPYVRTVEYKRMSEASYADFQQYSEGERDIDYISKLAVNESTPVFKSKTGYYAIFRATSVVPGQAATIDQLIQNYLKDAKYSTEYYRLPAEQPTNLAPYDLNNPTRQQGLLDNIRKLVAPSAQAAGGVKCFTNHRLPMEIQYRDIDTNELIPLKSMRDQKGAPVATMTIGSTGNVQAACSDWPPPVSNAYGVFNMGYFGGYMAYDVFDHQNNPWIFDLSCMTGWRFKFNTVVGYQPVNYADASQFRVTLKQNNGVWITQNRSSADADAFRIPADLYHNIANGAQGYKIEVLMRKGAPVCLTNCGESPKVTIRGFKVDEAENPSGPYSGALVSESPQGVTSSSNPYFLENLNADQAHTVTSAQVPGYDLLGYRVNGAPGITRGGTYNYVPGTPIINGGVDVWWFYRKRPTASLNITCGVISGNVDGGGNGTIKTRLSLGGELLPEEGGRGFSFTIPDKYKDGVPRAAELRVYVDDIDYGVIASGTHRCVPNAQCTAFNFDSLSGAIDANTSYRVTMTMRNTGEAIWKNYGSSNNYRLALVTGTNSFEAPATQELQLDRPPVVQSPVNSGSAANFEVTLKTKAIPTEAVINYSFKMVREINGTVYEFGDACSGQTRLRSTYGPWLRTQNGNVTALGKIRGQEPLTDVGGNRGGRREAATDGAKDDLNKEATYTVMSFAGSSGPFCSTNAYNLGRDADYNSNPSSCDFDKYTANLDNAGAIETVYDKAETAYNESPTSCPAGGPNQTGAGRYVRNDVPNGSQLPANAGACATIGKLNGDTIGLPASSNAAYSVPGRNLISRGRATILVEGNLFIGANIRRDTSTPDVSFDVNTMNELNSLPNLGIMVKGDIIIDEGVTRLDAMLFATGKIRTCDTLYNPSGSINDPNMSNGFKDEVLLPSGAPKTNPVAARCSQTLVVNGLMAAKDGFYFGRNYIDFAGIGSRIGRPVTDKNFEIQTATDYYGGPAEDVRYNGIAFLLPPPGFENVSDWRLKTARYETNDARPRF